VASISNPELSFHLAASGSSLHDSHLRRLHPKSVSDPTEIRRLLHQVLEAGGELSLGINKQVVGADVRLLSVDETILCTSVHSPLSKGNLLLSFCVEGTPYFFSARRLGHLDYGPNWRATTPAVVYAVERRDRLRMQPARPAQRCMVEFVARDGGATAANVHDVSPGGLSISLNAQDLEFRVGERLLLRFNSDTTPDCHGEVRNVSRRSSKAGWQRIGLSTSVVPILQEVAPERFVRLPLKRSKAAPPPPRPLIYHNRKGEHIAALVDSSFATAGAPAVVIPSYWGRTKESLWPLAATLVETFRLAGEPLSVVRFDGVRRLGESYIEPECRFPGRETVRNSMSQNVEDIETTIRFLESSPSFRAPKIAIISFSFSSIHVRRFLASTSYNKVGGWLSIVGATDLQDLFRSVSAGVDYVGGVDRGLAFGERQVLGVQLDVDRFIADAIQNRLAFFADACEEMSSVTTPTTWFLGQDDAWVDDRRVRRMLSHGDASARRLIAIPTGHILKSSETAIEVFGAVAAEVGRLLVGRDLEPCSLDRAHLDSRAEAERARLPKKRADLVGFWRRYLLGDGESIGFDLMASTTSYGNVVRKQFELLELEPNQRVADLGAGTGMFPAQLANFRGLGQIMVDEVDIVHGALKRARRRSRGLGLGGSVRCVVADLDPSGGTMPFATGAYDRVVASFLVNYLSKPASFFGECRRILKTNGRLVLANLRRDADVSKLYHEWSHELQSGLARQVFGEAAERGLQESLAELLNRISELVDLEDQGRFHFWDVSEVLGFAGEAGFINASIHEAFGDPPQALILRADCP